MKKKKPAYNYYRHTLLLDLDDPDDVLLNEWLHERKTKKNNFSQQIKKALRAVMEKE